MRNDPVQQFRQALADAGVTLHPSAAIRADGVLHRARSSDDAPGKVSCWYRLHLDAPVAGAGGSWKSGASVRWCSKRESALTASERAEIAKRITEDKKRAQEATEARHKAAAAKAVRIWAQAAPASTDHPYLLKKQIKPGVCRQSGNALVLPIVDFTGKLWGLQFIDDLGQKRFISGMAKQGHFISVTEMPAPDKQLIVCEGWGTASSVAELSPGACVIAALDAGNLQHVATEARRRFPRIDLVIAADADEIGMAKAKAAAIAANAKWIWPRFPKDAPEGLSDFNDWVCWRRNQRAEGPHV